MLQIIGKYLIKILGKISEFEELNRTRSKKVKMFAFKVPLIIIWKGVKDKKKNLSTLSDEWVTGVLLVPYDAKLYLWLVSLYFPVGVSKIILYS